MVKTLIGLLLIAGLSGCGKTSDGALRLKVSFEENTSNSAAWTWEVLGERSDAGNRRVKIELPIRWTNLAHTLAEDIEKSPAAKGATVYADLANLQTVKVSISRTGEGVDELKIEVTLEAGGRNRIGATYLNPEGSLPQDLFGEPADQIELGPGPVQLILLDGVGVLLEPSE